jgi:3-hydroxymyristoyl/3-hydroxydecanoyl-(acyl carrier protein) dehydratase
LTGTAPWLGSRAVQTGDFSVAVRERTASAAALRVRVPADLKYLEGHFPGHPIVPGVAQLLLVQRAVSEAWPDLHTPAGIRRLKFQARIDPGVEVDVALVREDRQVGFRILHGDTETTRGALVY